VALEAGMKGKNSRPRSITRPAKEFRQALPEPRRPAYPGRGTLEMLSVGGTHGMKPCTPLKGERKKRYGCRYRKKASKIVIQAKEVALARLIYIMGPSGSGKDSLMAEARLRLPAEAPVVFAHRYITRPADAGGENHVALSRDEFELRLSRGLFALSWESHGFAYGIGREIDIWMEAGLSVVVNGSREALSRFAVAYPELLPVLVDVPEEILRQRLGARGREDAGEIKARLARAHMAVTETPALVRFDNSGPLAERGQALAELILETALEGRTA